MFRTPRKGALLWQSLSPILGHHFIISLRRQQNTGLVTWADWTLRWEMRGVCHPRCQGAEGLHFCLWLETGQRTGEAGPCLMTDSHRRANSGLTRDTRLRHLWDFDMQVLLPCPGRVCQVITSRFPVILLIVWHFQNKHLDFGCTTFLFCFLFCFYITSFMQIVWMFLSFHEWKVYIHNKQKDMEWRQYN